MAVNPGNGTDSPASKSSDDRAPAGDDPRLKVVDRRWWARGEREPVESVEAGGWEPRKPTYVEELEQQLADKNQLLQKYITQYKEASGEFEDAKARIRRDIAKDVERGRRTLLVEMLDVLDNLERATAAARDGRNIDSLLQGLDMVEHLFAGKLEGFGVRRINALGERFDSAKHEAVTTVPTINPSSDETIVGVIRNGYTIGDDVLRPATVAVAKLIS